MLDQQIFDRIQGSFDRQTAMTTIGARLIAAEPGTVTIELPRGEHILQQNSFVHGGVLGMIADSACGYAALTLAPLDKTVLTSEYKINLLAPAVAEHFEAVGRVIRAGKRIAVVQGDIYGIGPDEGSRKHVGIMLATLMFVDKTPGMVD